MAIKVKLGVCWSAKPSYFLQTESILPVVYQILAILCIIGMGKHGHKTLIMFAVVQMSPFNEGS